MQWLSLDISILLYDPVFRALLDSPGGEGVFARFLTLAALAKEVADLDPDRWQGHLVSSTNCKPLTVQDMARAYPQSGRNRVAKMQEALNILVDKEILEWSEVHGCWVIVDWLRWWKKSAKPSTERVQRFREKRRGETVAKRSETLAQDKHKDNNNNPLNPPEGETGRPAVQSYDPDIDTANEEPEEDPRPASGDKRKLSSLLTVTQQRKLRQVCANRLQQLSPVLNPLARDKLFHELLEVLPPREWPHQPKNWASLIAQLINSAAEETAMEMKRKVVQRPADYAIAIASAKLAEKLVEYA